MSWKNILKMNQKEYDEYVEDGKIRGKKLEDFVKKIEPMMEKILNYHVYDKDDYNDKTRDKLRTALNQAFNFNRISVDYVPEDASFYIDISEGEGDGEPEGDNVTYRFDENGRFSKE